MATRRLLMDFASAFYGSKFASMSAVGMNCLGSDWDTMCKSFRHKNFLAGDIKSFGPTLDGDVVAKVYHLFNRWYEVNCHDSTVKQDNVMRNMLGQEILNSKNVAYDTMFETMCCSPSGQPMTVIMNTLCLIYYIVMAWFEICDVGNGEEQHSFDTFLKNVDLLGYGDDFLMSVSDLVIGSFNNKSLQACLKDHGIIYTGTDKQLEVQNYCTLSECSFLGRQMSMIEGRRVGHLSLDVINDVVNWCSKKHAADVENVMHVTCLGVLQEMFFHGRTRYTNAYNKLQEWWIARGKRLPDLTYEYMMKSWKAESLSEIGCE